MTTATAPSPSPIQLTLLRDISHGGLPSQPADIATLMTDFVSKAKHTLHIAIYDFRLSDALGKDFVQALIDRANAGVDVKIAYDHTKPNAKTQDAVNKLGGDPAPKGTHQKMTELAAKSKVQTKPILTIPAAIANDPVNTEPIAGSHLMHSKYVVRDTHTTQATVLTGSTNFTDDAWSRQENNILRITSAQLAQMYETDFQDLWTSCNIKSTGVNDKGSVLVRGVHVDVAFAPGEGAGIDTGIASLISSARNSSEDCLHAHYLGADSGGSE